MFADGDRSELLSNSNAPLARPFFSGKSDGDLRRLSQKIDISYDRLKEIQAGAEPNMSELVELSRNIKFGG